MRRNKKSILIALLVLSVLFALLTMGCTTKKTVDNPNTSKDGVCYIKTANGKDGTIKLYNVYVKDIAGKSVLIKEAEYKYEVDKNVVKLVMTNRWPWYYKYPTARELRGRYTNGIINVGGAICKVK